MFLHSNVAQRFPQMEFTNWNPIGIVLEMCWKQRNLHTIKSITIMKEQDFSIFRSLLSDVHSKAFGEPISRLPHSKAHTLAWLIEEATGVVLSYKSLTNYINAVLEESPEKVNPNCFTLSVLAQFATGEAAGKQVAAIWFKYRAGTMAGKGEA